MTFITRFKNIFHTAVTGTATAMLIAGGASAAQAAVFTFNYDGVVTELIAVGQTLPPGADIRGVQVGDRVSGSYSYDDRLLSPNQPNSAVLTDFIYSVQASDGNTYVETLDNFLGVPVGGFVNLNTGDISVGISQRPVPVRGAISSNQGQLFYGVLNTAIVSTFEPIIASNPESVPEFSSTLALLAFTLAPMFLRSRSHKREQATGDRLNV